jgi:hypothetical protein
VLLLTEGSGHLAGTNRSLGKERDPIEREADTDDDVRPGHPGLELGRQASDPDSNR